MFEGLHALDQCDQEVTTVPADRQMVHRDMVPPTAGPTHPASLEQKSSGPQVVRALDFAIHQNESGVRE